MKTIITILFLCSVAVSQVKTVRQSSKHHLKWAVSGGDTPTTTFSTARTYTQSLDGMMWHPVKKQPWDVRDHWTEVIRGGKSVAIITQDGHTLFSPGEDPAEITSFMLRLIELTAESNQKTVESQNKETERAIKGWKTSWNIAHECLTIMQRRQLSTAKKPPRT